MLGRSVGVPAVTAASVSVSGPRSITVGAVVAKTAAALAAVAPQQTFSNASLGNSAVRGAPTSARVSPPQRPTSRGVGSRPQYVAGTAAAARGPLAYTPQQ